MQYLLIALAVEVLGLAGLLWLAKRPDKRDAELDRELTENRKKLGRC